MTFDRRPRGVVSNPPPPPKPDNYPESWIAHDDPNPVPDPRFNPKVTAILLALAGLALLIILWPR